MTSRASIVALHDRGAAVSSAESSSPRIVAIGGGTGLPVVLHGLAGALSGLNEPLAAPSTVAALTAIVTVTDDGGSSGQLRRELGVLPPGDVRNCLVALAPPGSLLRDLLQHRFVAGSGLTEHPVGNLLLAALSQMTGDFASAVEKLSALLHLRGTVLPSTRESVALLAEFEDGNVVRGESAIVATNCRIRRLTLERPVRPVPEAIRALINADAVVVGPGSLYTSVLPNLLIGGIASTLSGVGAVRIYVANLMTEPGETDGFTVDDHLRVICDHVGFELFDYVLVNSRSLDPTLIARYCVRGAAPVVCERPERNPGRPQLVERELACNYDAGKIRHEAADLGVAILDLVRRGRPRPARLAVAGDGGR
jgi:uncharacterized cofD-like protein